ncbi:MAG: DUF2139 domain-containing protein [Nitrososphaerota archaeon]|nr:DUF2139 domain-containing protein [Candidatus Bathyarchaeota archaeon]MCX8162262.1 DUF2139 domain-containing protein [Candidatus Bathyarchaeota archaeon]MDW8062332.1 DUF2139 domain-containing protein [Nitrososphaerota archaeon]
MGLIDRITDFRYTQRYGPEWGSGGIFGLRYYKGMLYFTLAFEAEAHFIGLDRSRVYRFDQVGVKPGPRSGGDTYNAVETVDDKIYFGGWVHAPAVYSGKTNRRGKILFHNKFSHLHSYDIYEDHVKVLWTDSVNHETEWAGEVSEIIYDPVGDGLFVGRADGHRNLGIYYMDREEERMNCISSIPGLKGTRYLDQVCFDATRSWIRGVEAIQMIDLVTKKLEVKEINYRESSVDGGSVWWPYPGCATSAYSRIFFFVRGGVIVGDPTGDIEELMFVRLFDFGYTGYSPTRTMAKSIAGGVLVAFNGYTHGVVHPRNDFEEKLKEAFDFIVGPSILLYITPPSIHVASIFGARITGFESIGEKLIVALSNEANLAADDATPIDTGVRELILLDQSRIFASRSKPIYFQLLGRHVGDTVWGGIPLYGYKEPRMIIRSRGERGDIKLTVYSYDLNLPVIKAEVDSYTVKYGEPIDLSTFRDNIVSFKFDYVNPNARIKICLS